ncbi:hypothetical protein [Gymnodinialimonas hymeniacidonis]|uniref:hypothetical protein n=1 Tax=Gymnodinialimonas hymeniacidonis TaxID=3126508 RepID=UPI0034C61D4D
MRLNGPSNSGCGFEDHFGALIYHRIVGNMAVVELGVPIGRDPGVDMWNGIVVDWQGWVRLDAELTVGVGEGGAAIGRVLLTAISPSGVVWSRNSTRAPATGDPSVVETTVPLSTLPLPTTERSGASGM